MSQSSNLFSLAKQYIPGGVNSPVRSFNGVGGTPIFFSRGAGAYVYDEDNNKYIDYVASWGPLILGHCHPAIVNATEKAIHEGMSFGAPTKREVTMAEMVCRLVPSIEMVRMVNSGTEATMSAIRLARGYTGRNKIIKFIGCYHGHADSLLVKAGSGLLTFSIPGSLGVPEDFVKHTLTVHFNQLDEVKKLFEHHKNDIACIIVEPVACNMNCVIPQHEFLKGLRKLCDEYQSILIFDEVITGFRLSLGGAQEYFGVKPDLTTLGKIIGGGMPVGAYGGKREIMEQLAPLGPVYQAGTLSGNPVAMAAGIATLTELQKPGIYKDLESKTTMLLRGLNECAKANGIPLYTQQVQSIFGLFFTDKHLIQNYDDAAQCHIDHFKKFFHAMLQEGIYLAPSAFEAGFISTAHTEKDIEDTISAADRVFKKL